MRRRNRETEQFSISFLDVASCGFGAVIILLMITKSAAPTNEFFIDTLPTGSIEELTRQLFAIRSQTTELQEELNASERRNAEQERLSAGLDSQRRLLEAEFNLARNEGDSVAEEIGELLLARQTLTEEMQRLFEQTEAGASNYIGGVPVDSEYVIFVIDTSGSMYENAWGRVLEVIEETLDVYPEVKGIQVMNDMGDYMFSSFRGDWIPDTPARRRQIISSLRTWGPYSNSSPVEGVTEAVRSFYEPGRKISVYVLGDDFQQGGSIEQVLRNIDRINAAVDGERLVRIHGIGFPVILSNPGRYAQTGYRYASLMRELTERNGGTFVGLNDFR
ncbi:MAG: VWA domain-containing protein [Gammaproteobacteria bacterium]|nr:VWA domain-containing protein [Gammaproteobacteria bacterium]